MEKTHNHHIVHHGKQYESGHDTKWIRRMGGLIVPMVVEVHKDLHDNCPGIPLIDIFMARRVRSIMAKGPTRNPLEAIDTFSYAVEQAMEHPRTYDSERLVGEAAIMAIRMQIPFIEEGMRGEY